MIACLFSGGKDSTLALHKAAQQGSKAELLLTMVPESPESYMFHKPNIMQTRLQAESLGIRQVFVETEGEKEKELDDLESALYANNISTLITGAIASNYQRKRIQDMCDRLGIKHVAPLWGIDPAEELRELAQNYEAIITHVAAEGLDASFLGARIDTAMAERLAQLNRRYGISLIFEGGEAESFVLDAPMFSKRIVVRKAHNEIQGSVGTYVIDDAILAEKQQRAQE
ncbi:diphthine--ammonia ligase [Candidatus Marsarchaeota archaeon]|nr:diphthine--ammonia ligase [Candidatus Marsarchaeota archaeon]MCL5100122.1 diphthine--ammonia ligase [Candidatus Marsarchaeota archaeon]